MPSWVIVISTIFSVITMIWGLLFSARVPQVFGVYDAGYETFRGKVIVTLIMLFPIVAIGSLYIAWTSNSYFALLPFVHFAVVYFIRKNKHISAGPTKEYSSSQQNIESILKQIDECWDEWTQLKTENYIAVITFYAQTNDDGVTLKNKLSSEKGQYTEMELTSYKNRSINLDIEISLVSLERAYIETMVKELIELAWKNDCELTDLDILED